MIGRKSSTFNLPLQSGETHPFLAKAVKGKSVLDIGCIGSDSEKYPCKGWLHDHLRTYAQHVTGLDLNKAGVERLCGLGYDIRLANAESFDLGQTYEVVFAGDLIEHLYNPGCFLSCVRYHMSQSSRFILITPNPWRYGYILDLLHGPVRCHADHTCWFDPVTLSHLLEAHGFEVEAAYWTGFSPRWKRFSNMSFRGLLAKDFMLISRIR